MPYIAHPFMVLSYLYDCKESQNIILLAIATILHDVVEDCDVSIATIGKKFGHRVAALVEELTSDPELIKAMGKEAYLKAKMKRMSSYALVIKLCDRLHNLQDRKPNDPYCEQTRNIIQHISTSRSLTDTHKKIIKLIKDKTL